MDNSNILFNRYEVLETLSETPIFYVCLANDVISDKTISLYIMKELFFENKAFLNNYAKGIDECKDLNHPNTLKFLDMEITDDYAIFLYEGQKYKSLQEILTSNKTFSIAKASEIINSVLKSLDNAHINRLCHGDLSSDDVLIGTDGLVKIRGYGRKDAINSSAEAKELLDQFTIFYQSPEVIANKTPNELSDIYSAGTIFYQMLSGKVPFEGSTTLEIGAKVLKDTPLNLRLINKDVPSSLNTLILKSISKEPGYRPETASIFLSQISEILKTYRGEYTPEIHANSHASQVTLKKEVPKQKNATIPLLLTLFALTVFATMIIVYVAGGIGKATVPDVLGLSEDEARIKLEDEGLSVRISESVFSSEYAVGTVVHQIPNSGKKTNKGSTVILSLSKGNEFVEMPDVTGMSKSDAVSALQSAGLSIGSLTSEYSDKVDADYVIQTYPEAGMSIASGSNVDITVSKGERLIDPREYEPPTPKEPNPDDPNITPSDSGSNGNGSSGGDTQADNPQNSSSDKVKRKDKKSSSSDDDIVINLD